MSPFYKQGNPLLGSTMTPLLVFEAVREFIESSESYEKHILALPTDLY